MRQLRETGPAVSALAQVRWLALAQTMLAGVFGCEEQMITVAAAASHLGIGVSTVRDAIRSGKLRHYRFGVGRGTIRIDPADLEDYRQRCLVVAPVPQAARVIVPRELEASARKYGLL